MESGFFLESDAKIVAKSIRDRVALIKWRRERTVAPGEGEPPAKKRQAADVLRVPGAAPVRPGGGGVAAGAADCDQEEEPPVAVCYVVPDAPSMTCERSRCVAHTQTHTITHTDPHSRLSR